MFNFVEEISFEEIKEVWEKELWPDKKNGVAKRKGGHWMWTVPRESALPAYKSAGFVQQSDWFEDGQYGPNCIASKYL